jgi:F0F1-type ATP synthase membrane subunit b/b'
MTEIPRFIETFLGAPLQLVIILLFFGVFLYWFIKERPKSVQSQNNLINTILEESRQAKKDSAAEKESFFKIMDDYRAQNERVSALYDKALENSTRAIENNTEVIKNQNTHAQLTNQALETLNDSVLRAEDKLEKIGESQQRLVNKVNEAIIIHHGKISD